MTQPANRRLVTEDRFLVTEAEAAAAYDAVNSIASLSPNYIINGAFDIWQRGTSFSATSTSLYTADRWVMSNNGGTSSVTRQTFTPGTAPVAGYEGRYFLRHAVTTIGTISTLGTSHRIEDVRTLANQTATVSFWAKADASRVMTVRFDQDFGTGGSPSSYVVGTGQNVTLTSSWVRYSLTFNIGSISGKTIGTGDNSKTVLVTETAAATGSYVDIWGVQVEAGSVATAFRRNANSLQGELAACQRYYTRFSNINSASAIGMATAYSTGNLQCFMNLPVTMRTIPSAESGPLAGIAWEGGTSAGNTPTTFSIRALDTTPNVLAYELAKVSGWASDGRAYHVHLNTTSGAYIAANAEL